MKRWRQNLDYVEKRRGRNLDATGAGPYIKLGIAVFALAAAVLALVFVIVPVIRGSFSGNIAWRGRTPAPDEDASVTPAVPALITSSAKSFSLNADKGEAVMVDPVIIGDTLVFASGDTEEACGRIVCYNLDTRRRETIEPVLENDSLRMPRANEEYLVWFDAKADGGGNICVRSFVTGADIVLVQLTKGMPELLLDGRYLVFMAQSGLGAKLYAIDLSTFEPLTLALLPAESYAASTPDIAAGRVYFPVEGGVRVADLSAGGQWDIAIDGYVHDPRAIGEGLLWLTGDHGGDTDLHYLAADGTTLRIAQSVIHAGVAEGCIAFGRDGTVYAYSLPMERIYMISGAEEYAQLVAAGGNYILWRVLSDGEAPAYRYLRVN